MKENNNSEKTSEIERSKSLKENILSYDDNENQTLFKFLGIEMTAPKGLKNPRIVYISFIVVNLFLLIILKNLISN